MDELLDDYGLDPMVGILGTWRLPFGQWKGHYLFCPWQRDRQYLRWLDRQEWARRQYPEVHAFLSAMESTRALPGSTGRV